MIRRLFVRGRDGPRAACRLLQPNRSTSTTDGPFEPRAPHRWSPTDAALFASGCAGPRSTASLRMPARWSAASREFTGQGQEARVRLAPHCLVRLPLRSLATGALPQPDRPGHPLSQACGAAGWSLLLRRGLVSDALFTSLPDARRFRDDRLLGPPHALLREEPRAPLHPRCLPSPDNPVRGFASLLHNLSPACGVWAAGAFSIFVRPSPLTRRRLARGLDRVR